MVDRAARRWIFSQVSTVVFAIGSGFEYIRWKHSPRSDAPVEIKIFLGTTILFLLLFVVRVVYRGFVTKRDYFGEEMARRHSLAKGAQS